MSIVAPPIKYVREWDAPTFVSNALKKFTGENGIQPADYMSKKELKTTPKRKKGKRIF